MTFVKTYSMYISRLEWRLGDSLGISVTNETLERATRVKRLIGRPQEALLCAKAKRQRQSAQSERKSTTRYGDEPKTNRITVIREVKESKLLLGRGVNFE